MKFIQYLASFAIVALVLSLSAFAKDNHSGKFHARQRQCKSDLQNSRRADYKAEWSGPADNCKS